MDDQTFETLEMMPLQRYEMACSCLSITLSDDPNPYYIVGTAYAIPDEQEPSKVWSDPALPMHLRAAFLLSVHKSGSQQATY